MNIRRFALPVMLLAFTLMCSVAPAATLPLGCWNVNGNGHQGLLCINVLDAAGNVTGTIYGVHAIRGFWDEAEKKLIFRRISGTETIQVWTGYWFPDNVNNPNGLKRLAGSFEAFQNGGGGTAPRHMFGWTATRP